MKILASILFVLIILILGVLVWVKFFAGSQTADYLSGHLTTMMKVPVKVENIAFKKDSFSLEQISIKNPERAKATTALKINETEFITPYTNYLKSDIVINKININDIYLNIEFYNKNRTRGNWITLIDNLNENGKDKKKEKGKTVLENGKDKQKDKGKTVLIKHLVARNISIDLLLPGRSPIKLKPIKQIEFHNLSSEKGFPIEEITEIITKELLKQISILKGLQGLLDNILDVPLKGVEDILSPFKSGGGRRGFGFPEAESSPSH